LGEDAHGRYSTSRGALLWGSPHRPDERLAETNNEPGEPRQVPRKLGSTDSDGQWQLGSPTAANDEKTQTVTGHKRRAPMAATDAPTMPAICRRRFSTTPTRRKRKQWKPACGPG